MITFPIDTFCEIERVTHSWVITITGPYGCVSCAIPDTAELTIAPSSLTATNLFTEKRIQKMIIGASTGFKRYLRIRGVGYHLKPSENNTITMIAGFSFDVSCPLHPSITVKATRKFAMIKAQSKYLVTTTNNLALLRRTRKADIYRGLGIYYRYEKILYKPGSKQKTK